MRFHPRSPLSFGPSLLGVCGLALASGCTPHDGEVTGDYLAYFAEASSQNILNLQGRGVDFDEDQARSNFNLVPIDCRDLAKEDEGQRLPGVDYEAECTDGGEHITPTWFYWLDQYAYLLKEEQGVKPWRVEAVKTSEHDLQLTVHVDAGRFGDFRYGFVVDPVFQPTDCVDNGDGTASLAQVDGDWVQGWTDASREASGTFYHLNAYAYQINPSNAEDYWSFDHLWYGGYAFGRYGDEELYGHQLDYIDPYGAPLYYLSYQDGDVLPARRFKTYTEWVDQFDQKFAGDAGDGSGPFNDLLVTGKAATIVDVRMEDNTWRLDTTDAEEVKNESSSNYAYGLENWAGVSPTWVHFDQSPDELRALEPGVLDSPLTGQYTLFLEPVSSATKIFVQGTFSIDRIRNDAWGYAPTLEEDKRDENNTPECGEDRLTIDEG